jgi:hypothetical protein
VVLAVAVAAGWTGWGVNVWAAGPARQTQWKEKPAEEPVSKALPEADYATYDKLRLAKAAIEAQCGRFGREKEDKELRASFAGKCTEAGWTERRYQAVNNEVEAALSALENAEDKDPDIRDGAKQQLQEVDPATLATVKAHRKDLGDRRGFEKRVKQAIENEQSAGKYGRPASAEEIQGKWTVDYDYLIAQADEIEKGVYEQMRKDMPSSTYAFGPGDKVMVTNQRAGKPLEKWEGTYQYAAGKVIVKGSGRQDTFDVRIKDGRLSMGLKFGRSTMFTIYRRE